MSDIRTRPITQEYAQGYDAVAWPKRRLEQVEARLAEIHHDNELRSLGSGTLAPAVATIREEAALVEEKRLLLSRRWCPSCKEVKTGWPHTWANEPGKDNPRGVRYVCADCYAAARARDAAQAELPADCKLMVGGIDWLSLTDQQKYATADGEHHRG